ncbi:MAG: adenylyl-sulfate kinase [Acidaminococcaceae bacterium]|nr:adenylyl-sulfate kinase [Acidaminococcaceae bacterium]
MKKGTLYFFTGLSGAGKTTIGGLFYRYIKAKRNDIILLDGDQLRAAIGGDTRGKPDYSTEARRAGMWPTLKWCKLITDQGIDIVYCTIAMYDEIRDWNRAHFENYKEIYIKVSMDTLFRRDQKQLYSSGAKNVVGVDLPYDEPKKPDFVVENDGQETPEEIVARLERHFGM